MAETWRRYPEPAPRRAPAAPPSGAPRCRLHFAGQEAESYGHIEMLLRETRRRKFDVRISRADDPAGALLAFTRTAFESDNTRDGLTLIYDLVDLPLDVVGEFPNEDLTVAISRNRIPVFESRFKYDGSFAPAKHYLCTAGETTLGHFVVETWP